MATLRTTTCSIRDLMDGAVSAVPTTSRGIINVTLLAAAASSVFTTFNPGVLVAVVNTLLALGKYGALDAVERRLAEADRIADPQHGLFLILRLLFEVPADPGFHPPMHIGIPNVAAPRDAKTLPHFPLIVVDDIPLLLITTFIMGGSPELVEAHLKHFHDNGTLRTAPLTPKTFLSPAKIIGHLIPLYRNAYGIEPAPAQIKMLEQQLRRMQISTNGKPGSLSDSPS